MRLIYGASQIVQVVANGERYVRGTSCRLSILNAIENDTLAIVVVNDVIKFVGYQSSTVYQQNFKNAVFDSELDVTGCCIIPGLIDSHTHPVWQGDRINEFKMKLEGATYMDIHKAGGGIHYSVKHTTNATDETLYASLVQRLGNFTKAGTTFVECKSGYGLEWPIEHKMLRVLTRAKRELKTIHLSNTYLGGHAVPRGKTAEEATQDILNEQLPKLKQLIDNKQLDVDNVDVFCEKGVFDVAQTEAILKKAQMLSNLNVNFHSDELYPLNSVEMAVRINSKAVSHLEEISESEIELMAKSETVGILLPTTAIIMQLKRPPARRMLAADCIIALGSDFNPNAYCFSMPMVMSLACVDLRLTMDEALIASTINSAFALGVEKTRGSVEVGKQADLVIIEANRWENLIYQIGAHDTLIRHVIVDGQVVYSKTASKTIIAN